MARRLPDSTQVAWRASQSSSRQAILLPTSSMHVPSSHLDHLDQLQGDPGDGAGGAEDDDLSGAEGVSDGEQASLEAEGVAEGSLAVFKKTSTCMPTYNSGDVAEAGARSTQ